MSSAILSRSRNVTPATNYITNFTRLHNFQNPNPDPNRYRYITFRISSFTKTEVRELRKRLISDLERVRILRLWICSSRPPMKKATVGRKRSIPIPGGRVNHSKLAMRKCGQILGKLMQHKHGWVFNKPVDVESLNLYDYNRVVKTPMDLGTIKEKIAKNMYDSPLSFAADVRLTFENAMLYNGKGSEVFVMAKRLLLLFDDLFDSSCEMFNGGEMKRQKVAKDIASLVVKKKPVMTADEKTKLRARLWNMQIENEGVNQIMAILKKGVGLEENEVGEIEVDLAVLDNETLWELQSFIDRRDMNRVHKYSSAGSEAGVKNEDEEDIDIGEEMQLTDIPCIEIKKDAVNVGSNGSSSGDSGSSSCDSGSGSS